MSNNQLIEAPSSFQIMVMLKERKHNRVNFPLESFFPLIRQSMKMFKAVKQQLKFWSKKRKRKSLGFEPPPYPYPNPPLYHYGYYSSAYAQPSAPPLPSWLQAELAEEEDAISPPDQAEFSFPTDLPQYPSQEQDSSLAEEEIEESHCLIISPAPDSDPNPAPAQSYQQYMDPNPVYGVRVAEAEAEAGRSRRERSSYSYSYSSGSAGLLGRVVDFGLNFFQCFCPCFTIRDREQVGRLL